MDEMTLDQRRALAIMQMRKQKAEAEAEGAQPESRPQQTAPQVSAPKGTFAGEGVLRGINDPFTGLAQGFYNLMPQAVQSAGDKFNDFVADKTGVFPRIGQGGFNEAIKRDEADYQARRGGGLDVQRITGNVISPINAAIGLKAPQAASLGGRMVSGSAIGGTQAMTMPVTDGNYWGEKAKQANTGLAVGGALPLVAGGVARMVSPKASVNPDIALLKSKGINPTIGQTLGGIANKTEQKATSLFGVGDSIQSAREASRNEFNRAILNDTVEAVGTKVDDIGHAGVKQAGDAISGMYDDVWTKFKGVQFDKQFADDFGNLRQLSTGLTPQMKAKFDKTVNEYLASRVSPNGGITSETLKKAYSDIGNVQRQYAKASGSEGELGAALKELQSTLMDQVGRSSPQAAQSLKSADLAWAKLVRLEDAAKRSAINDGVFTPGQYLQSVKANSASVRGRDFSRGTALGQELGEAGQRVLGNTYPDSGTAGRLLNVGHGAAAMANLPLTAGGMAIGMGAYTPAMQKALTAAVSKRGASAPFTAEQIRKLAPVLNPAAYGLLYGRE